MSPPVTPTGRTAAGYFNNALSDEELNAYIDGELSIEERRLVERLVATEPGVRARVEALLSMREHVREAYRFNLKE